MTFRAALAVIPAALLGLAACETYDDGYGYSSTSVGVGYSYGSPYSGYSRPYYGPYGGVGYYDSFYDNFYGPVYGGYWATDGFFWYQTGIGGVWLRDGDRHFRHDRFDGARFQRFQAHEREVDRRNDNGGWFNDAGQRRGNQNNPASTQGRDDNGRTPGRNQGGWMSNAQPSPAPAPSAGDDSQLEGGQRWGNRGGDGDNNRGNRGGGSVRQRSAPQPDATPTPAPAPAPQRQPWMRDRSSGGDDNGGSSERSDRSDRGDRGSSGGWSGNRGGGDGGDRSGGNDDGGGRGDRNNRGGRH